MHKQLHSQDKVTTVVHRNGLFCKRVDNLTEGYHIAD